MYMYLIDNFSQEATGPNQPKRRSTSETESKTGSSVGNKSTCVSRERSGPTNRTHTSLTYWNQGYYAAKDQGHKAGRYCS